MSEIPDFETLEEAKLFLRKNWEKGVVCPCCNHFVKRYKYAFHNGMARALIYLYQATNNGIGSDNDGYINVNPYFVSIGVKFFGYHPKLEHWRMIERMPNTDTTKPWSGYWRITERGKQFADGNLKVAKHVYLYNKDALGFSDELIDIRDALGKKFDYDELMNVS